MTLETLLYVNQLNKFTTQELNVIVGFINFEQWDGAEYVVNGVNLNQLKNKIKNDIRSRSD